MLHKKSIIKFSEILKLWIYKIDRLYIRKYNVATSNQFIQLYKLSSFLCIFELICVFSWRFYFYALLSRETAERELWLTKKSIDVSRGQRVFFVFKYFRLAKFVLARRAIIAITVVSTRITQPWDVNSFLKVFSLFPAWRSLLKVIESRKARVDLLVITRIFHITSPGE